jgi:hypothetical protein
MNQGLAGAAHAALLATLHVEKLEDTGVQQSDPETWRKAALAANRAQREKALLEARRNHFAAELVLAQAQATSETATGAANARKEDKRLQADVRKALADLAKAKSQLDSASKLLAKAEQEARQPPTTAHTKRTLATYPAVSSGRRLALARWITDRRNPLTARVAMNHVWLRHFGKPVVPSVFDFGRNGQPASHPALLDWLASEFMDRGWSMKSMHRLIVLSSAYRMESTNDAGNAALDPDNRYLWRMTVHRLEAEAVRDSVLAVAGSLDTAMGGPDIDYNLGLTMPRRSLYFRHAAEKEMEFLYLFDAANVTECYQRPESIIPQQALALSNSALVLAQARLLARRLDKGAQGSVDAFIRTVFEQILSRDPTVGELATCTQFLAEQASLLRDPARLTHFNAASPAAVAPAADPAMRAREDLVQVLLNHNDFVTIR